ncbi:MAG: hypothetical protein ACO1Q7_01110 [Gemmatimonas sp.]
MVNLIWVECAIESPEQSLSSFGIGSDGKPRANLRIPPDVETLVATLQYIESLGSFWLGIHRIYWNECSIEWRPESPEEKQKLSVFSHRRSLSYPRDLKEMTPRRLAEIMRPRVHLEYLVVPLSFFREGDNDFLHGRDINAFFNFYFFLEGLYGGGKSKNDAVRAEFLKSSQMRSATQRFLDRLNDADMAGNRAELDPFPRLKNCDYSVEGLIKLLVSIRGTLHHFSASSTQMKGHPLNQDEFRVVAFLALSICMGVIPALFSGSKVS